MELEAKILFLFASLFLEFREELDPPNIISGVIQDTGVN